MDLKEVQSMSLEEEREHWWIRTRFNYINRTLAQVKDDTIKVLEFGCGTGQNLWFIRVCSRFSHKVKSLIGIDTGITEGVTKQDWMKGEDFLTNEVSDRQGNCLLAMDVLEHIDDAQSALKSWVQHIDQGGVALLTVPAFQHLWSYHDEFLDHKRRYTKSELLKLAQSSGLKPVKVSYAFGHLYPVVLLVRKLLPAKKDASDLSLPPFMINRVLRIVGYLEAKMGGCPWFGTSVIGIFVKE